MSAAPPWPEDIAQRIARGDVAAFEQVYRDTAPRLCAYIARYLHDEPRALELTQQLFLDLWVSRDRWEITTGLRAYLFASARNRALNARRRARVEEDWTAEAEALPDRTGLVPQPPEEADARVLRLERMTTLARAMDALPERCRMAMHLRWREELSYEEVATVLGITVKAVEKLLVRGMATLRQAMR